MASLSRIKCFSHEFQEFFLYVFLSLWTCTLMFWFFIVHMMTPLNIISCKKYTTRSPLIVPLIIFLWYTKKKLVICFGHMMCLIHKGATIDIIILPAYFVTSTLSHKRYFGNLSYYIHHHMTSILSIWAKSNLKINQKFIAQFIAYFICARNTLNCQKSALWFQNFNLIILSDH